MKRFSHFIFTLLLSCMIGVTAWAGDNGVYIDQIGSTSTITIEQNGSTNTVKGIGAASDTKAKIYGSDTTVSVTQTGTGNQLNLGINGGLGDSNSMTYEVTGSNGSATINMNNDGSSISDENTVAITQGGNYASTNVTMTGTSNSLTATQTGGNNQTLSATIAGTNITNTTSMTGGASNSATLNLTSNKGTSTITTVGASNTVSLTQSGTAGTTGHTTELSVTGSSNSATITQSGTIDTHVAITSVGNGNTLSINSHN
jgi:hypothetical protein